VYNLHADTREVKMAISDCMNNCTEETIEPPYTKFTRLAEAQFRVDQQCKKQLLPI